MSKLFDFSKFAKDAASFKPGDKVRVKKGFLSEGALGTVVRVNPSTGFVSWKADAGGEQGDPEHHLELVNAR